MKNLISIETARLASEKGYDGEFDYVYLHDPAGEHEDKLIPFYFIGLYHDYSVVYEAPHVNDLATWLGNKKVFVYPTFIPKGPKFGYTVHVFSPATGEYIRLHDNPEVFETPYEAYDKGLKMGLFNLITF